MNISNNETINNETQCCIDYCKTSFIIAEQEVVNMYKCNQKQLSSSEVWNIQRQKKYFNRS
jgi:hypothetical protein